MDDLLELLPKLIDPIVRNMNKHLATALAIFGAVVAFLVQRKEKRKQRKRDAEQRAMLLALLSDRGISWNAEKTSMNGYTDRRLFESSLAGKFCASLATVFTRLMAINQLRRKQIMTNKLKSRKFWMAVVTAVLIVLNDGLGLGIDSDTVLAFAGVVATFIIGEAAVDASRSKSNNDDFSH